VVWQGTKQTAPRCQQQHPAVNMVCRAVGKRECVHTKKGGAAHLFGGPSSPGLVAAVAPLRQDGRLLRNRPCPGHLCGHAQRTSAPMHTPRGP
jgi:hypothetical protein